MKAENLRINQKFYHCDIYKGKEQMKLIGIKEHEVLLEGDFSGGTNPSISSDWFSITGLSKQPITKKIDYIEVVKDDNVLVGYAPIFKETGKQPKMMLNKEKEPMTFKTKEEAIDFATKIINWR
jgi:hypothetical protein